MFKFNIGDKVLLVNAKKSYEENGSKIDSPNIKGIYTIQKRTDSYSNKKIYKLKEGNYWSEKYLTVATKILLNGGHNEKN